MVNETVKEKAKYVKNSIKWSTVLTMTVAALVVAGVFYLMTKSDIKLLEGIAKAA